MFRIKICGITSAADAEAAVAAGADAIGLNFFPQSPRFVRVDTARAIADAVGRRAQRVGVFVNAPVAEILATADAVGLDLIQLHGDERPEVLRQLAPRGVMKAFRLGPDGLFSIRKWFDDCLRGAALPKLVLLDAHRPGQYGGTGETADWSAAAAYVQTPNLPPLVLAGGLTPLNVAEAIARVRPAAVDTAGGVEVSPGVKDAAKMRGFVAAARAAFP